MKIKMKLPVGGEYSFASGEVLDTPDQLSDALAVNWMLALIAEPVDDNAALALMVAKEEAARQLGETIALDQPVSETPKERRNRIARERRAAKKAETQE